MTINERKILMLMGMRRMTRGEIEQETGFSALAVTSLIGSMVRQKMIRKIQDGDRIVYAMAFAKPAERKIEEPFRYPERAKKGKQSQRDIIIDTLRKHDRPLTYDDIHVITGIKRNSIIAVFSDLCRNSLAHPVTPGARNRGFRLKVAA